MTIFYRFVWDHAGSLGSTLEDAETKYPLDYSKSIDAYQKEQKENGLLHYINEQIGRPDTSAPVENAELAPGPSYSGIEHDILSLFFIGTRHRGSYFFTLLGLSKLWKIPLNSLFMADIVLKQSAGFTFGIATKELVNFYQALIKLYSTENRSLITEYEDRAGSSLSLVKDHPIYDQSKWYLLYAHLQDFGIKLAKDSDKTSDNAGILHFSDHSEYQVIRRLYYFFSSNPQFIPKNVTLQLIIYHGGCVLKKLEPIKGTGDINYNFRNTIHTVSAEMNTKFPGYTLEKILDDEPQSWSKPMKDFMRSQHCKDAVGKKIEEKFIDSKKISEEIINQFNKRARIIKRVLAPFLKKMAISHRFVCDYDRSLGSMLKAELEKKTEYELDVSKSIEAYQKEQKQNGLLHYMNEQIGRPDTSVPAKNAELAAGSARFSIEHDIFSLFSRYMRKRGSYFFTLLGLSKLWKIPLRYLLMADIVLMQSAGFTFGIATNEIKNFYQALMKLFATENSKFIDEYESKVGKIESLIKDHPIYDRTKGYLLYAHLQDFGIKLAKDSNKNSSKDSDKAADKKGILHFSDDLELEVIWILQEFFSSNPQLIPKNITLQLIIYNGSVVEKLKPIEGAGDINYHFRDTIHAISAKMEAEFPGNTLKEILRNNCPDYLKPMRDFILSQHRKDAAMGEKVEEKCQDNKKIAEQIINQFNTMKVIIEDILAQPKNTLKKDKDNKEQSSKKLKLEPSLSFNSSSLFPSRPALEEEAASPEIQKPKKSEQESSVALNQAGLLASKIVLEEEALLEIQTSIEYFEIKTLHKEINKNLPFVKKFSFTKEILLKLISTLTFENLEKFKEQEQGVCLMLENLFQYCPSIKEEEGLKQIQRFREEIDSLRKDIAKKQQKMESEIELTGWSDGADVAGADEDWGDDAPPVEAEKEPEILSELYQLLTDSIPEATSLSPSIKMMSR